MPYTFAHPVIVLPLKKLSAEWFSTTGLVAGSIAPDLPYFVTMDATTNIGHTWYGAFLVDLPVAFLVALVFHLGIRGPLINHLPHPLDEKYADCLRFNFLAYGQRKWGVFLVSVLIGIWSHLAWDNFVSPAGWFYRINPSFFEKTVVAGPLSYPVHLLVERAESVIGLGVLGWIVLRRRSPKLSFNPVPSRKKAIYWAGLFVITGLITFAYLLISLEETSLAQMVVVISAAALAGLGVTSTLAKLLSTPDS